MNKLKKNVCMFGAFSGNNRGDFAILETIIHNIKDFSNHIYISSKKPLIIKNELLDIENVTTYKTYTSYLGFKSLLYIYKSDVVTIGGGGLFFEKRFLNVFFNHLIGISAVVFIANLLNKDIYIFGVGAETFHKRIPSLFLKYILKNSTLVSVRDRNSLNVVTSIYKRKYNVFNDPVLSTQFSDINKKKERVLIIINKSVSLDGLLSLITLLNKQDFEVTLFENEREQNLARKFIIKNALDKSVSSIPDNTFKNTIESISFISGFALTISAPMHGSIFSYIGKTPFIAISWNEKVQGFIDIIDNDYYVFESFSEINEEHILGTISNRVKESNFKQVQSHSQEGIDYFIKNFLTHE